MLVVVRCCKYVCYVASLNKQVLCFSLKHATALVQKYFVLFCDEVNTSLSSSSDTVVS